MINGIDVSTHQGKIDWAKVKKAGIDFAMLRSSFGWNSSGVDKQFFNNVEGCNANGIPFGAYHYSYALTPENARLEADFFLRIVKDTGVSLPLYLDFEDKKQRALPVEKQVAIIEAFLERVTAAGYKAGLYMSKNSLEVLKKRNEPLLEKYSIWAAQWNSHLTYSGNCDIWQYSSEGKVDGIATAVDLDYSFVDLPKPEKDPLDEAAAELEKATKRILELEAKLAEIRAIAE